MKLSRRIKRILYISLSLLFLSGLYYFILDHYFKTVGEFGEIQNPAQFWSLRLHSLTGLWFFIFFGYFYAKHIQPGLKGQRLKKSGLLLYSVLAILFLTVPGLFYLSDETLKFWTAQFHTYLGLLFPFFIAAHILAHKISQRRQQLKKLQNHQWK
jgi:hypothetical protein